MRTVRKSGSWLGRARPWEKVAREKRTTGKCECETAFLPRALFPGNKSYEESFCGGVRVWDFNLHSHLG